MPWTTATTRATGFAVTAAVWNSEHVDNMNFLKQVNLTTYTGDQSTSATTVGTATTIVSSGAITYEAVPHIIEFYCPMYAAPAVSMNLILKDNTTVVGTIARLGASAPNMPIYTRTPITPTAASHTYLVAAWLGGAGTATFNAGTGGTAGDSTTDLAGFIRIFRVPT
jgi:hypothetical protein